jgi:hypothetical protein
MGSVNFFSSPDIQLFSWILIDLHCYFRFHLYANYLQQYIQFYVF